MRKALIIKCFSGLSNALLASDLTGWHLDVFEDFKDPYNLAIPDFTEATKVALAQIERENYDLVLVEEPSFVKQMERTNPERTAAIRHKILVGDDASRDLEISRHHAKQITKECGIKVTEGTYHAITENCFDDLRKTYAYYEKIVIKKDKSHLFTIGTPEVAISLLENQFNKCKQAYDKAFSTWLSMPHPTAEATTASAMAEQELALISEVIIEDYMDLDNAIEFSVCGLANGKTFTPVCTLLDLENKIFPGRLGPKISDVSQIILDGVNEDVANYVSGINAWVEKTGYKGWLDLDLLLNLDDRQMYCFEYMVRFGIPSMAAVVKLYDVCWLDAFYAALTQQDIPSFYNRANALMSIGVGMFSFSTEFNHMTGDIPEGAEVSGDWGYFWLQPNDPASNAHLVGIEVFHDTQADKLYLSGNYGRHFYAIGLADNWEDALAIAYKVCDLVDYPNKVYKRNLFGYESPLTSDSDLEYLMPFIETFLL